MVAANKRRYERVQARSVAAHLTTRDGSARCVAENISLGGVFFRTDLRLDQGMPVVMDLVRPGLKRALRVTGRVVASLDAATAAERGCAPGLRIQFDPASGDIAERLRQMIEELRASERAAAVVPLPPSSSPDPSAGPRQPSAAGSSADPDGARLMVQVKGLLMELGEVTQRADQREREVAELKAEIEHLRYELAKRDAELTRLKGR